MPSQIGCQMYTLRDFTKTPGDLAKALAKVKKIGYDAVQTSGHGSIEAKELGKMLREEGLTCAATHVSLEQMKSEPQKVIERLAHFPEEWQRPGDAMAIMQPDLLEKFRAQGLPMQVLQQDPKRVLVRKP